jgi:hypothetical protein
MRIPNKNSLALTQELFSKISHWLNPWKFTVPKDIIEVKEIFHDSIMFL